MFQLHLHSRDKLSADVSLNSSIVCELPYSVAQSFPWQANSH